MIKHIWIIYFLLIISNKETIQEMSCTYDGRGSLTSTCYNARSTYFKQNDYKFDHYDETVRCVNCYLAIIEESTFDISNNRIQNLDLQNSHILILSKKSFAGLIFLRRLNLSHNNIMTVPAGTFEGSRRIEELNMENNLIRSLAKDGFKDLVVLTKLNLKRNQIKTIERGSFNDLVSLEELNLAGNRIETIENGFEGLKNIAILNLEGNNLSNISLLDFKEARTLLDLNLARNNLTSLKTFTFRLLLNLENLHLFSNPISDVNVNSFVELNSLEQLDLSRCRISKIPKGLLSYLHQLRILDLSFNNLEVFQTGFFSSLPELRKLNVSHNDIVKYSKTGVFVLHRVHSLDLSFNGLTDLDYKKLVHDFPALSYLGLKNNTLPCYLKQEMQSIFEHDNLVFDWTDDTSNMECHETRSPIIENETFVQPSKASALYQPPNDDTPVLYSLVVANLVLISGLAYLQYRHKRAFVKIFGNAGTSQARIIASDLKDDM